MESITFDVQRLRPFEGGGSVTPSDTVDLPRPVRGLVAAGAGNIAVIAYDNSQVTIPFAAGVALNIVVKRVLSTGTTATGIVGLW